MTPATHFGLLGQAADSQFDFATLGRTAAYFVGVLALVAVAKLVRDAIALRRGQRLSALVADHNNTPIAVEMGGFALAMVLGLTGSLMIEPGAWWEEALSLVATAAIVFGVLLLNDQLVTRFLLGGLDCNKAVADDHNLAVAIVRAAGNVGAALALRGALGHESPLEERLVWVVIGQVAIVLMARGYQLMTPYDDAAEVRYKNVAAALPLAGMLIAVGVVVGAALTGEGHGLGQDLLAFGLDLGASAVLVIVLRWAGDALLLPGTSFATEIARDKNAGAGFIEASVYVAASVAVAFFLN